MIINTNITSLNTQLNLNKTQSDLQTAMQRLSSGLKINSAADDAAGLAISARMTSQINGMTQAAQNSNDGISLIQTADGALSSVTDILQRMRDLAVQADNGTYSTSDRTSMNNEFSQLSSEITHIASTTSYNGVNLLDGSTSAVTLHISDAATDTMGISLQNSTLGTLGLSTVSITSATMAEAAITSIDAAVNTVTSSRATLGSYMNRLNFTINNLNVTSNNMTSARSRIQDADMAQEMSRLTKDKILTQTATSMLAQANSQPQLVLSLLNGQ